MINQTSPRRNATSLLAATVLVFSCGQRQVDLARSVQPNAPD